MAYVKRNSMLSFYCLLFFSKFDIGMTDFVENVVLSIFVGVISSCRFHHLSDLDLATKQGKKCPVLRLHEQLHRPNKTLQLLVQRVVYRNLGRYQYVYCIAGQRSSTIPCREASRSATASKLFHHHHHPITHCSR